jgi:hypothetical protein
MNKLVEKIAVAVIATILIVACAYGNYWARKQIIKNAIKESVQEGVIKPENIP